MPTTANGPAGHRFGPGGDVLAGAAVCGSGTTCSATFTPSCAGSNLVAFVSSHSTEFPPPGIVASPNVATTYLRLIP